MAHPYVIGDFTWNAMDYLGESGIVSVPLTYEPGVLEAINYRGGSAAESSSITTSGSAVSIRLTPEEIPESFP